jgi:hypothetical protein
MPDILKTKVAKKDFCFNFSSGVRILIYVRNDSKSATSSSRRGRSSKNTPPAAQGTPPATKKSPTKSPTADIAPTQPRRSERLRKKAADANK